MGESEALTGEGMRVSGSKLELPGESDLPLKAAEDSESESEVCEILENLLFFSFFLRNELLSNQEGNNGVSSSRFK